MKPGKQFGKSLHGACSSLEKALPLDAIGIDLQAERRERVAKSAPLKNQTPLSL